MSSDNLSSDKPAAPRIALTPTGTQSVEVLALRRAIVAGLNILLYVALAWWAGSLLGAGGWSVVDVLLFVCFLLGTPWAVLGFWNSIIGLWLLHGGRHFQGKLKGGVGSNRTGGISTKIQYIQYCQVLIILQ